MKLLTFVLGGLCVTWVTAGAAEAEGQWKTAFYKRGFCGTADAVWFGGEGATQRMPIPVYFDGSKARVWFKGNRQEEVVLARMSLVKAANRQGEISGKPQDFSFQGQPSLTLPAMAKEVVSDEVAMPVSAGLWYLQQNYSSPKYEYAYDADGVYFSPGDATDSPSLADLKKGAWPGNAYRIDVWTADPRPVIACWGDSITQGAYSTPMSGNRYPERLAGLIGQPTINLGVNGDLATYAGGVPSTLRSLNGVGTVVFLMGINDIISGKFTTPEDYIKPVTKMIGGLRQDGKRVFLGTIMPSGGYEKFDADPAKETLRLAINEWIRNRSGADGVIDFDEALRDPASPGKLQEALQDDWLHPNDAGYQKMAETAAAKLKS